MATDLSKLILDTDYKAFMNNNYYSGSFVLGGTVNPFGQTVLKYPITLTTVPDITQFLFNKNGTAEWGYDSYFSVSTVINGGGYTNYPVTFNIFPVITGNIVTFFCTSFNGFITSGSTTITNITVNYMLIDYSVF